MKTKHYSNTQSATDLAQASFPSEVTEIIREAADLYRTNAELCDHSPDQYGDFGAAWDYLANALDDFAEALDAGTVRRLPRQAA